MSKEKSWGQKQFDCIMANAKEKYGKGWAHMSVDQQQMFIDSQVLSLLLAQDGSQFAPAHELVQKVCACSHVSADF